VQDSRAVERRSCPLHSDNAIEPAAFRLTLDVDGRWVWRILTVTRRARRSSRCRWRRAPRVAAPLTWRSARVSRRDLCKQHWASDSTVMPPSASCVDRLTSRDAKRVGPHTLRTRSSTLRSTPACCCATSKKPPVTLTRAPRCAATEDANRWIAASHHRGHVRRRRVALTPESGVQRRSCFGAAHCAQTS
jgi:hypothetical protein